MNWFAGKQRRLCIRRQIKKINRAGLQMSCFAIVAGQLAGAAAANIHLKRELAGKEIAAPGRSRAETGFSVWPFCRCLFFTYVRYWF